MARNENNFFDGIGKNVGCGTVQFELRNTFHWGVRIHFQNFDEPDATCITIIHKAD